MNFAKAVNLAMRNGFAKFAMWFANFAMRNFAKVLMRQMNSVLVLRNWHCEIGIAKLAKLALRNSHCEIRIAKLALRILAMGCEVGNVVCEMHSILRLLFHCSCILLLLILSSTASHFLHFSFDFPLIFGLVDG